jgi:hypothetical protein
VQTSRERQGGVDEYVGLQRRNARGDGKIMLDLCDFTLRDFYLKHDDCLNRGIPIYEYKHESKRVRRTAPRSPLV